jgi:hypothetical protein
VWEHWQTADQQENQDDDKNCADAHDEFLLVYLESGYAVQAAGQLVKKLYRLINPTVALFKRFWSEEIKNNIFKKYTKNKELSRDFGSV